MNNGKKAFNEMSGEEMRRLSRSPMMRLYIDLVQDEKFQIIDPIRVEKAIAWTRMAKKNSPAFSNPEAMKLDVMHLGLIDEHGSVDALLVAKAREYIKEHDHLEPQIEVLWRYLQSTKDHVSPAAQNPDFEAYNAKVADLVDQNVPQLEIAQAIVEAESEGLDVPTRPLFLANRALLAKKLTSENYHHVVEDELQKSDHNWFASDGAMVALRRILKDKNYGLGESELNAWVEDQGQPSTRRQIRALCGQREKAQTLKDLGVLTETSEWSELGFQRFQTVASDAYAQDQPASLEWIRLELLRRYRAGDNVPFEWLLLDDRLTRTEVHRARRLASIALSGGLIGEQIDVGETVSQEQLQYLRAVGAWVFGPHMIEKTPELLWLSRFSRSVGEQCNWDNWRQVCSFIYENLDKPADPELIKDWQTGLVTFEGHGVHQNGSRALPQKKVGRNDPCPCGSGKKFKKCCGAH